MENVGCSNGVQLSFKNIMLREYKAANKLRSKYKCFNLKNCNYHKRHDKCTIQGLIFRIEKISLNNISYI